jgi:hypothetical protein
MLNFSTQTKSFRAKNLMESQKVKVLEAFDKATTVKEVKLVFETLMKVKETKAVNRIRKEVWPLKPQEWRQKRNQSLKLINNSQDGKN